VPQDADRDYDKDDCGNQGTRRIPESKEEAKDSKQNSN
jgi:hypothetical protein